MKLYMKCTNDKYELPLAVEGSPKKLAKMLGLSSASIMSMISKGLCGYHRIEIDDEEDADE